MGEVGGAGGEGGRFIKETSLSVFKTSKNKATTLVGPLRFSSAPQFSQGPVDFGTNPSRAIASASTSLY